MSESSGMIETKKDFTAEVQAVIPESVVVADSKGLDEAILLLLGMEKKCRINNDFPNLKEVCLHMVRLCRTKNDWTKLNSTLAVINKRRAQSKLAISAVVAEAMKYIEETPSLEVKIEHIKALKEICAGKMYVEGESAQLHLMLALILEEQGDISGACDMIQDVHVETYGALTKKEKAEYILEQIRLNLRKKDYVRALIQSRKMNRKVIEEEGFEEVKVKFYRMMVEYYTTEKDSWEICQSYYKIYDTTVTKADPQALRDAFESCVVFLCMSKYESHQSDMMHRLKRLLLEEAETPLVFTFSFHPVYSHALSLFTTKEIIPYPFEGQDEFQKHPCLSRHAGLGDASSGSASTSGASGSTLAAIASIPVGPTYWLRLLHNRIIQHNLRVVSSYYRRIRTVRLAAMIGLSNDELEEHLSEVSEFGAKGGPIVMGRNKKSTPAPVATPSPTGMYVKIDRPAGVISFAGPRAPEAVLSDWASDVGKMLSLLESTCHLINRENMVHKV